MPSKLKYNYFPELRAFLSGRPGPTMVTINLTEKCNQHCIYCEIGQGIPSSVSDSLTKEDMLWMLDEMESLGIPRISLCGGEPFLFKDIMEVINYATFRNIRCSVTTNGMTVYRLNDREFEVLKRNRADINLSIDSFHPEINALTRGTPSALENALKSIEKLKTENIPFTLLAAISRFNYPDLYQFVVQAYRMGVKQVLFQPVIHYTNYPDRPAIINKAALNVPADEVDVLMENLQKILQFERHHSMRTNVYRIMPWVSSYLRSAAGKNGTWFFEDILQVFYCREIFATIDIAYDGGIQPCGLTRATVDIHDRRGAGLMELWEKATEGIKDDISHGRYYLYCNACCHKFSRNMLASMMKYPVRNRKAWTAMLPLVLSRMGSQTKKKILNIN